MSNVVQWLGEPVTPQPPPQHPVLAHAERLVAFAGGPRIRRTLGEVGDGARTSWNVVWTFLSIAGAAAGAYHGYKRNHESVGWAIGWSLLGAFFPIVTLPVSVAQGFGKPKGASDNPSRVARRGSEFAEVGVFEHEGQKFEAGGAFYDAASGTLAGYPSSVDERRSGVDAPPYELRQFDGAPIAPLRLVSKYRSGFGREQMWSWSTTYDGRVFHGRNLGPNMFLRMRAGRSSR